MTADEKHAELGRMVVERAEVRRELACVKNRLSRYNDIFAHAQLAISGDFRNWRAEGDDLIIRRPEGVYPSGEAEGVFPSPSEFAYALQARIALTAKLADIEQRMNEAGC